MKLKKFVSIMNITIEFLQPNSEGRIVNVSANTKKNFANDKYNEWRDWGQVMSTCNVRGIKTKNSMINIPAI